MKKLLLALLLGLMASPALWACSCLTKRPVEDAYRAADVVVKATMIKKEVVVGVGPKTDLSGGISRFREYGWNVLVDSSFTGWPFAKCTFTLNKIYKGGDQAATIVVSTGLDSSECSVEFELGHPYLIYAANENGYYSTNICTRTQEYNQTEAQALEGLAKPVKAVKPPVRKRRKG